MIKKVLFWVSLLTLGPLLLAGANMLAPDPPAMELPPPLIKYTVGCFIGGQPIFMGDVIGQMKINERGEITFFSLDWNSQVKLVNASCISMESRMSTPTVRKDGDTNNNSDTIII